MFAVVDIQRLGVDRLEQLSIILRAQARECRGVVASALGELHHGFARPQNVANLMDALRRSIAEEKASSTPPKKGRKRIEGQGEMLLPIAGKAKKVATAEPSERQSARQKNVG